MTDHAFDISALTQRLELRDRFAQPLQTVAGFCVEVAGANTVASAVLLDARTLAVLDQQVACVPVTSAPVSGQPNVHEVPALLAVLDELRATPDLSLVEGHGVAHAQRLGTAAHFGVVADLPCIGVATAVEAGTARLALHEMRGAFTPLRDGPQQIGWLLRSRPDAEPLVVSPGHRVSMPSAPELVMRFVAGDRRPEPTRLARLLLQR